MYVIRFYSWSFADCSAGRALRVLVALQGHVRMHVGVDNLNVVNHVSGILAGRRAGRPFSLVNDGDLLLFVQDMIRWRGSGTASVN